MNITLEETEYCQLTVHYEADKEELELKRNEVLQSFKRAPVKGFRKGKEPIEAIQIQYRDQINESLKRAMAEHAFHNVLFEKNIKPLGSPNFTDILLLDHKFSCSFSLRKKPDFELAEYKGFSIPKQPVSHSINDMTQLMLQELRVRFGTSNPYEGDDFVQMGDTVVVDYKAFNGDVSLDAVNGSGETFTVGKIGLPGFDEELLGMKVDETKTFSLVIPEGGLPSLVGQTVRFEVVLIMGSKSTPCSLDDELGKKAGMENYQQLLEAATNNATARHTEMQRAANLKQISARLLSNNEIKVPSWLTLSEAQYLVSNAKLTWDTLPDVDRERFMQTAELNVKMALILDKIREQEPEAQLSDQEVLEMLRSTVAKSGSTESPDQVLTKLNQSGQLAVYAARIRDEFASDFLIKNTNFTE